MGRHFLSGRLLFRRYEFVLVATIVAVEMVGRCAAAVGGGGGGYLPSAGGSWLVTPALRRRRPERVRDSLLFTLRGVLNRVGACSVGIRPGQKKIAAIPTRHGERQPGKRERIPPTPPAPPLHLRMWGRLPLV